MGAAAGIPRPEPGRRGAGADRAGQRPRRNRRDRRVSRRGLPREDADRHQPARPRRGAPPRRLVRHQDEPRGDREPGRRKDDEAHASAKGSRTRRRFAPGTPTCRITSTISAISSTAGAGSPAIISRSPTSPRRRICRRSTISATCRGTSTSWRANGTRGSSRARAFARSSPTTCPACRRPSITPTSIFESTGKCVTVREFASRGLDPGVHVFADWRGGKRRGWPDQIRPRRLAETSPVLKDAPRCRLRRLYRAARDRQRAAVLDRAAAAGRLPEPSRAAAPDRRGRQPVLRHALGAAARSGGRPHRPGAGAASCRSSSPGSCFWF